MTETEKKALALVNEVRRERGFEPHLRLNRERYEDEALCHAIEQHEAFKREVSDAVEAAKRVYGGHREAFDQLDRFIIPKTDPLVDALLETFPRANGAEGMAADLRAAIEARGGRIVWEGDND